jgi:hypothetical protein
MNAMRELLKKKDSREKAYRMYLETSPNKKPNEKEGWKKFRKEKKMHTHAKYEINQKKKFYVLGSQQNVFRKSYRLLYNMMSIRDS